MPKRKKVKPGLGDVLKVFDARPQVFLNGVMIGTVESMEVHQPRVDLPGRLHVGPNPIQIEPYKLKVEGLTVNVPNLLKAFGVSRVEDIPSREPKVRRNPRSQKR